MAQHALATLRHRDFTLISAGQLVSSIGDQMQSVGIAWHVYLLTNSPLQLGLLGLARAVPFMSLSLAGGALADSVDRKRLLAASQLGQMVLTTLLMITTATGRVNVALLYGVTFMSGAAMAFDTPARQAIVPNVVPRRELAAALTLMALMRQVSFIAGPGIGGLVIARFGLAPDYLGNALSFLAVVIAVVMLKPIPRVPLEGVSSNWDRLLGGVRFARRQPLVLLPMLLDFFTRLACNSRGLLPIFARDIFLTGAEGFGWLNSALSGGAVLGGLLLGRARQAKHPIALMACAYLTEGLFIAGMAVAPTFGLAIVALVLVGIANVYGEVLRNTVLQLKTPDELRGRVTALSNIFDSGGPQLGQVRAGAVANVIGPVGSAVWGGLAATAIAIGFVLLPGIRRSLGETSDELAQEL